MDVTGVTLPMTKHNYLVTRAEEIMPAMKEAFYIANRVVRGRCWWTSPRMRSRQDRLRLGDGRSSCPATARAGDVPTRSQTAIDMITKAKRPVILAGHGIMLSGARRSCAFAERAQSRGDDAARASAASRPPTRSTSA